MNDLADCNELTKKYKLSNNWCEPLWDTVLCWPTATLNETLNLPCPNQEFENQTAIRTCILYDDGFNGYRPFWTAANYSQCAYPHNHSGLFLDIAWARYNETRMWELQLLTLSQFIYFNSFIVLVIALTIYVLYKKLRNARTRLHMHMFAATIMQIVMWLMHSFLFDNQLLDGYMYLDAMKDIKIQIASKSAGDFREIAEELFTRFYSHLDYLIIVCLERYFETSSLFWLLMEGWFLYELICLSPLEAKSSIRRYVIVGWGVPLIVTGPWVISHLYSSYNDVYWASHDFTVYIIAISIFVTFLINVYFFIKISGVLLTKMKLSVQMQQKTKMEYTKWVRSTFMLVLLFGAQNLLYCVWFFMDKNKPKVLFLLVIKIISSFQGCFVSLMYCFLNTEVRTVLQKNLFCNPRVRDIAELIH